MMRLGDTEKIHRVVVSPCLPVEFSLEEAIMTSIAKLLTDEQVAQVHEASLHILEDVGLLVRNDQAKENLYEKRRGKRKSSEVLTKMGDPIKPAEVYRIGKNQGTSKRLFFPLHFLKAVQEKEEHERREKNQVVLGKTKNVASGSESNPEVVRQFWQSTHRSRLVLRRNCFWSCRIHRWSGWLFCRRSW